MIPLLIELLEDTNKILTQRRSPEERQKNYIIAINKKIQQYIKEGSMGHLDLRGTPITSLPDNLIVGGGLHLSGTKITSLPSGLEVKADLVISDTKITSLPADLIVGENIFIYRTPLDNNNTIKQIEQMAPGIKGIIIGNPFLHASEKEEIMKKELDETKRMQQLAGILNEERGYADERDYGGQSDYGHQSDYGKESYYGDQNEDLDETQANALKVGRKYTVAEDIGKFKAGDEVTVASIVPFGDEIKINLSNSKGVKDFFILDKDDDFDLI